MVAGGVGVDPVDVVAADDDPVRSGPDVEPVAGLARADLAAGDRDVAGIARVDEVAVAERARGVEVESPEADVAGAVGDGGVAVDLPVVLVAAVGVEPVEDEVLGAGDVQVAEDDVGGVAVPVERGPEGDVRRD